jgi:hypothetical protein
MGDDDLDAEPFGKDEGEDLITEGMVKKGTYLIHKLAERRGADFKEIQKKCRKLLEYDNLAKVPISKGHAIIDKLIALTGGEEEKPQPPTTPDDGLKNKGATVIDDGLSFVVPTKPTSDTSEKEELETELGKLAEMLQICVGFSRDIVQEEIGKENISEGTQAMLVKSFAATLYIDASKRGLGR